MTVKRRNLPGDRPVDDQIERMIRVNQAGEFGAVRIYQGQLAVLGKTETGPLLEHMLEQEKQHLDQFNEMMAHRHVRPTALSPLWSVLGFALGAGTALMGKKAAMACTVAVEEVIDVALLQNILARTTTDTIVANLHQHCTNVASDLVDYHVCWLAKYGLIQVG